MERACDGGCQPQAIQTVPLFHCDGGRQREALQKLRHGNDALPSDLSQKLEEKYLLAMFSGGCKEQFLQLLNTLDITKVTSMKSLTCIFKSLGKLMLENIAEKCFLDLKTSVAEVSPDGKYLTAIKDLDRYSGLHLINFIEEVVDAALIKVIEAVPDLKAYLGAASILM